jgi:hypothetical protein
MSEFWQDWSGLFTCVIPLIAGGLFFLFTNLDWAWKFQEFSNRIRGIPESERTPEWETSNRAAGCLLIFAGLFMLFLGLHGG